MQIVKPLAAFALAISTGLGLTLGFLSPSVQAQSDELPASMHSILEPETPIAAGSDSRTLSDAPSPATPSPATLDASLAGDTVSQAVAELSAPSATVESLPAPLPESQLPESPARLRPQQPSKPGAGEQLSSPGRGVLSASDEALLFPTVPATASEAASAANAPQPEPVDIGSQNSAPDSLSPVVPASAAELVAKPSEVQDATMPRETNTTEPPSGGLPGIESAPAFPRGAAAIGQRGNAIMLVLPGGRIVLAPPGIVSPSMPAGQRPAAFASQALSMPPLPPLRSGFRNRLGRR